MLQENLKRKTFTAAELDRIGKAMGREYYRLCVDRGVPKDEYLDADEVCKLVHKSKDGSISIMLRFHIMEVSMLNTHMFLHILINSSLW